MYDNKIPPIDIIFCYVSTVKTINVGQGIYHH